MRKKLTEHDKKVIAFLKSKRAFAKFKRNWSLTSGIINCYNIQLAFTWAETKDGWFYWNKLSKEFEEANNDNH